MTLIACRGVAKRWDPTSGLAPVSFTVAAGELVVLRGRSGTGKSTLLAILAGWCEPDAGTVGRFGEWASRWRTWDGTAIVPQVLGLVEELSVEENVGLSHRLGGTASRTRRGSVDQALDELDLGDLAHRLPREISMGQRQRTAVARATVARPAVLLADEPTSHQDVGHASAVVDALRGVTAAGGGILVASHDPLIVSAADRLVSLDPL